MSYVNSVLQPGERVVVMGRLHWIIYWHAIVLLVLGLVLVGWLSAKTDHAMLTQIVAIIFAVLVVVAFFVAWFKRWSTKWRASDFGTPSITSGLIPPLLSTLMLSQKNPRLCETSAMCDIGRCSSCRTHGVNQ